MDYEVDEEPEQSERGYAEVVKRCLGAGDSKSEKESDFRSFAEAARYLPCPAELIVI